MTKSKFSKAERAAIGERIKKLMIEHNKRPVDVARHCGVSRAMGTNWRDGNSVPQMQNLERLADMLEVSWRFVLYGEQPAKEELIHTLSESTHDYDLKSVKSVDSWGSETPLHPDEVMLPFFPDIEIAAGSGFVGGGEDSGRGIRFAKSTLRKSNVPPEEAFFITVRGASMEPQIPDRSQVGINRAATKIIEGEVYAINHGGLYRLKVLYKMPGGQLRIHSYNTEEFPDELASIDDVEVIGQRFSVQQLFYTG